MAKNEIVQNHRGIIESFELGKTMAAGESVSDPLKCYDNNLARPVAQLRAIRQFGVTKFVFYSTCATYGIPKRLPITEDTPQRPINPYGQTKLDVETFAAFRYFNTAGAAEDGSISEDHDPETHLIPLVIEAGAKTCSSRSSSKSKSKANLEWLLVCASYNVKRLHRLVQNVMESRKMTPQRARKGMKWAEARKIRFEASGILASLFRLSR